MSPTVTMYITQAIHGLTYGMLLFLVASGLTLIFGMMGVLNFAHASFFMLSAYLCYSIFTATGSYWMALLLAPAAVSILGILVERFLLRRIQRYGLGHLGELLLTFGLALLCLEGIKTIWGTESRVVPVPSALEVLVVLGTLEYPAYRLFVIAVAVVILLCWAQRYLSTLPLWRSGFRTRKRWYRDINSAA